MSKCTCEIGDTKDKKKVLYSHQCAVLCDCGLLLKVQKDRVLAQVSVHAWGRERSSTDPTLGLTEAQETSERAV